MSCTFIRSVVRFYASVSCGRSTSIYYRDSVHSEPTMNPPHGTVVQKLDTGLNADTVEWCPYEGLHQYLLCGTYKLQESSTQATEENTEDVVAQQDASKQQVRDGAVLVYELSYGDTKPYLQSFASMEMCGVLDIKWPVSKYGDRPVFGLVNAEGYVQLMHLDTNGRQVQQVASEKLTESSLGLSLDWARVSSNESKTRRLATSDSSGHLTVFDVDDVGLTQTDTWEAHGYEAWITAFHNDDNILFSGGDDCKLKQWDLRDTSRPITVSRRHQMGVCSIQTHPFQEHIFASGSYDEELLVWDDRNLKSPLTSTHLGGGIWRIKWEPSQAQYILTATMYNGTHIVDCSDLGVDPLPIVAVYDDHNLAYGADWCRYHREDLKNFLVATCSFYDHALHIWTWEDYTNKDNS